MKMAANENTITGEKKKSFLYTDSSTTDSISNFVLNLINMSGKKHLPITFLCIGTDRVTGDSLGPMVGTFLKANEIKNVIGCLDNPVHAKNLQTVIENIDAEKTLIIAVDACLGQPDHVGNINVSLGTIQPGTGVGKEYLPAVGDIAISPVVNFGGFMDFIILQNTRLSVVYNMARKISAALVDVVKMVNEAERVKEPCLLQ
jgi:putative sporulation protein YyaC